MKVYWGSGQRFEVFMAKKTEFMVSGLLCCIVWWFDTNVSEELAVIFSVQSWIIFFEFVHYVHNWSYFVQNVKVFILLKSHHLSSNRTYSSISLRALTYVWHLIKTKFHCKLFTKVSRIYCRIISHYSEMTDGKNYQDENIKKSSVLYIITSLQNFSFLHWMVCLISYSIKKVKLPLCLTKNHTMKMYGGLKV